MWAIPKKYNTQCFSNDSGSLVSEHIIEAISKDEAESRAYLNCVIENNKNRNVRINVKERLR